MRLVPSGSTGSNWLWSDDSLTETFTRGSGPAKVRWHLRSAHGARAEVMIRLGRHAEALTDWDRAIKLDDGKALPYMRVQRALTLAHLKEHVRAAAEAAPVAGDKGLTA